MSVSRNNMPPLDVGRWRGWIVPMLACLPACLTPMADPDRPLPDAVVAPIEVSFGKDARPDPLADTFSLILDAIAEADDSAEVLAPADASATAMSDGGLPDAAAAPPDAADVALAADVSPPSDVTPLCSLFGSAGCGPGEQCYPDGKANLCSAPGQKTVGELCTFFNECESQQLCVGGLCRAICAFAGKDPLWNCPAGALCQKVKVGGKAALDLGVCQLP